GASRPVSLVSLPVLAVRRKPAGVSGITSFYGSSLINSLDHHRRANALPLLNLCLIRNFGAKEAWNQPFLNEFIVWCMMIQR
ncbi:MAG: hypothetical protein ACKO0V_09975, partial [bacterium]